MATKKQSSKERTILRKSKDRENPYAMIAKDVLQNEEISWKARGVMAYLLSLPDDWELHLNELETRSKKDGRDSVSSAIKELREYGYITRVQERDVNGIYGIVTYYIHEVPVEVPDVIETRNRASSKQKSTENKVETPEVKVPTVNGISVNGDADVTPTVNGLSVNGLSDNGLTVNGKPVTTNTDLTNKKYIPNTNITNQPINQEEMVERLDGILNSVDYHYLEAQGVDQEFVKASQKIITDLFFTDSVAKINGSTIPASIIQRQLQQIDAYKLEYVYEQFRESAKLHPITNEEKYLRSMIYNSLSGDYLKLTAKVGYSAFGLGRTEN